MQVNKSSNSKVKKLKLNKIVCTWIKAEIGFLFYYIDRQMLHVVPKAFRDLIMLTNYLINW